jgi:hypothetical protein
MDLDSNAPDVKPKPRRRDTNDVRAERKRELDRLAQRATRERTKNRIAFLEQKLASLESCDRESTISQLTKTIDNLRNDNSKLQSAMMKMRFAINEALDGAEVANHPTSTSCRPKSSSISSDTPLHEDHSPEDEPIEVDKAPEQPIVPVQDGVLGIWSNPTHMSGIEEFLGFSPNTLIPPAYEIPLQDTIAQNVWQQFSSTGSNASPYTFHLPLNNGTSSLSIAPDSEKWHVSNGALVGAMDAIKKHLASSETLDLHIPFRAGLWGWDSIPEREQNHPVWQALRSVDQKVFGTWRNKAARIAIMYSCQTMLQYRENPTKENLARVPKYLLPRPSQQRIQHPAVIDYLVWPGLRDRLVFEHDKYTRTGEFSAAFVKYAHFDWPYGDNEIYTLNPATGRWEVSKIFLEYVYDYSKWMMKPDFFKQFPEMIHDMNVGEGTVHPVPPLSMGQHWAPSAMV